MFGQDAGLMILSKLPIAKYDPNPMWNEFLFTIPSVAYMMSDGVLPKGVTPRTRGMGWVGLCFATDLHVEGGTPLRIQDSLGTPSTRKPPMGTPLNGAHDHLDMEAGPSRSREHSCTQPN